MRGGKLKNTVAIQANTPTQESDGSEVASWATAWTVRAAVYPLTARELMAAEQPIGEATHKIVIRYTPTVSAITAAHRILWGTRIFEITGIIRPEETRMYYELMCVETK